MPSTAEAFHIHILVLNVSLESISYRFTTVTEHHFTVFLPGVGSSCMRLDECQVPNFGCCDTSDMRLQREVLILEPSVDNGPLPVTVPAMQAGVGHGRSSPRKYCTYIIYLDFIGSYLAHGIYIYVLIYVQNTRARFARTSPPPPNFMYP